MHSSARARRDAAGAWAARAELLVFEVLGTDPLCEGRLPSLRHARASLLAPGARAVVPRALTVYASLVESEALASLGCVWRDATHGLDLRPLNALAHGSRAVRLSELPHSLLTDAAVALTLELDGAEPPAEAGEATTELVVRRSRRRARRRGVVGSRSWWRRDRLDGARRGRLDAWAQLGPAGGLPRARWRPHRRRSHVHAPHSLHRPRARV